MDARLQRRVQRYGWGKAAARYERAWQAQLEPAQTAMLEMAAPISGERVLDVACGTGLVTFRAAALVAPRGEVVGTDLSEEMVAIAGEREAPPAVQDPITAAIWGMPAALMVAWL
jgi:ubiquinone/menaquinone biosynthesis C-methylase UbiE